VEGPHEHLICSLTPSPQFCSHQFQFHIFLINYYE
jgi:hypothetical protein